MQLYELLKEMTFNNYQLSNKRGMSKKVPCMYDVDGINILNAKVDSLVKMLGKLGNMNSISIPVLSCDCYGRAHMSFDSIQVEQTQFASNFIKR